MHEKCAPRTRPSLLQHAVVVDRVVTPVDQEVITIDPHQRALGDVGGEVLHLVPTEYCDRVSALGADQDRPVRALPVVTEILAEVVQERHATIGVGDVDRRRQLPGDIDDPVLDH